MVMLCLPRDAHGCRYVRCRASELSDTREHEERDYVVSKDIWVLMAMGIYFVAMLTIGFVYSRRSNSSTKQYFAGGRGVGPWLTALSAACTVSCS